jgi:hypothetical protein
MRNPEARKKINKELPKKKSLYPAQKLKKVLRIDRGRKKKKIKGSAENTEEENEKKKDES